MHRNTPTTLLTASAITAALFATACATNPAPTQPAATAQPTTEEPALTPPPGIAEQRFIEYLDRIEAMERGADANEFTLDEPSTTQPTETTRPAGTLTTAPAKTNISTPVTADDDPTTPGITPKPTNPTPTAASQPTQPLPVPAAQRIETLTADLAEAVRENAADDLSPVPAMVRLALLDLFQPGVFNTHFPRFDPDDTDGSAALSPDDIAFIAAWRDLFRDLRLATAENTADLDTIADAARTLDDAMHEWRPLTIADAALCRRVDGFGVYDELRSFEDNRYRLLAGRRHPVVVYAELASFGHRDAVQRSVKGHEVALEQHLTLFHEGTPHVSAERDLIAWRTEPTTITDFSRNKRRDFFVVQVVHLPETLSVGSYRLKLAIDDRVTGESAERILDIDVVADISAFESGVALKPTTNTAPSTPSDG